MKVKDLIRYITICLLLIVTACQNGVDDVEDGVSLSLKLATSQLTRGAATDYPSDSSKWSQAEKAVDGRFLYNISVYIVDNQGQIVARQENISVDGQVSETIVEFDHSYNIKRGIYTIMAVANNKSYSVDNTTYQSGLLNEWASQNYESLMGNQIAGNNYNISPKNVIQPLSMMKEVELHAGSNMIVGELVRTFARIRIEVKNNSGNLPLKINSLSFSQNFTQKKAYVFDDGTERKYFGDKGAPSSTSNTALQPFVSDNSGAKIINAQTSAVVFDSYLLESKANPGQTYQYTLDMAYDYTATTVVFSTTGNNAISDSNTFNNSLAVGEEGYFLFKSSTHNRYLSGGESKVETASFTDLKSLLARNIWLVKKVANNSYTIQNVESGLYMQTPENNSVTLGNNSKNFSFSTRNGITMYSGTNNYVGMDSSYNVKRYNNNRDSNCRFNIYRVTKNESSGAGQIKYNTPIVLTSIDPISQQSTKVTAIKRNDFINILITVSYNPQSGEFDFNVEDWHSGGGEIEFN